LTTSACHLFAATILARWIERIQDERRKGNRPLPGFNFINVLLAAFTPADPESVKIQFHCQYIFTLLGSEHVKAASM